MKRLASLLVLSLLACKTTPAQHPTKKGPVDMETEVVTVGGNVGEPPPNPDALPLWSAVKKGKLSNGLTYYILPHKKPEQRAFLWLAVNAGSMVEDDDQRG